MQCARSRTRSICGKAGAMANAVYILCFLTSAAVAILLLRGYVRSRARLLLWCSLGFLGLSLNNLMLIADSIFLPNVDLSVYRTLPSLIGTSLLVFGLMWESSRSQGRNP